jgi:hypothetical protein
MLSESSQRKSDTSEQEIYIDEIVEMMGILRHPSSTSEGLFGCICIHLSLHMSRWIEV